MDKNKSKKYEDGFVKKGENFNQRHVDFYKEYGFLVIDQLMDKHECDEVLQESTALFRGERGHVEGLVELSNDVPESEVLKSYLAIHFPHKLSSLIKSYAAHPKKAEVLSQIIGPNVKCMQTMLFIKAPGKPGQAWHQDEYYIPTRDKSLTGAWMALEDSSIDNGCLWVIPGSHKDGYIRKRVPYNGDQFGDVDVCDINPYTEDDFLPVEVKKGSVIFFNGYLLHMSRKNYTEDKFRRALVTHYMSAESMLPWDMDGMIDMREDMRDIFMVCGNDPYEHVGKEDNLSKPFLRPEKVDYKKQNLK